MKENFKNLFLFTLLSICLSIFWLFVRDYFQIGTGLCYELYIKGSEVYFVPVILFSLAGLFYSVLIISEFLSKKSKQLSVNRTKDFFMLLLTILLLILNGLILYSIAHAMILHINGDDVCHITLPSTVGI